MSAPPNAFNSASILPPTQSSGGQLKQIANDLKYNTSKSDDAKLFQSIAEALSSAATQFDQIFNALRAPLPQPQATQAVNANGSLAANVGTSALANLPIHNWFDYLTVGSPPTLGAGFRLFGGNMQFSNDGVTWTNIGTGSGSGNWTEAAGFIFPTTITDKIIGGITSSDLTLASGSFITSGNFNAVTAAVNASVTSMSVVAGTYSTLAATISGAGAYLPLAFFTNNAERFRVRVDGVTLFGASSTDLSLLPGDVASIGLLASFSSTTNTSVLSIKADTTFGACDISSGSTGTGTTLPIRFLINPSEMLRILTTGQVLFGITSTDYSFSSGSVVSVASLASVTAATNASVLQLVAVSSNYCAVNSDKSGTGTYLPIAFRTSNQEQMRILTGTVPILLAGATSTDLTLSTASLVAKGSLISITAATNASSGTIAAISGLYVSLSSSRTGAGSFLPMAFFTNNTQQMTLLTNGRLLIGTTSDDGLGADLLQVNGVIRALTGYRGPLGILGVSSGGLVAITQINVDNGIVIGYA